MIAIGYDGAVTVPRDEKSTLLERDDAGKRKLSLLVIGQGYVATHPLPEGGDLTIGRSKGAEVCIDLPQISRQHAILHLGSPITLEDLGSANGTRVRERELEKGQTVEVAPGDVIELGSTLLLLQRREPARRPKRVWSHGTFEGRLEDECARAEATGQGQFALVRLRASAPQGVSVPELIASLLRAGDVLAEYGPDDYEVLLLDADREAADRVVGQLDLKLRRSGIEPRTAIALYPAHGRSPEVLMAIACDGLGGAAPDDDGPLAIDPAILQLDRLVDRLAAGTINVLLLGETGVGKEVFAEKIHRKSPRSSKPLLKLNCAAFSEQLLESELFGHEKGAFTGASATKLGLLETADGGTVFLDELGELPLTLQAKLLRVLEDRAVMRVGGTKPHAIDVRFVAATNKDLEAEMARGTFRKDLYFRLSAATLLIPPLRERPTEIRALAQRFIAQFAQQLGRPPPSLSPAALKLLDSYDWPGNVRELRNVIERAVLLTGEEPIGPELLPVDKMRATLPAADSSNDLRSRREAYERDVIIDALERANGNQTVAARTLGIARRTLITRIEQYGLPRPRKGR